jgi:inner membrane protein
LDNVCHSLAGAALAQSGFARRLPRATIFAVIAANIPDVDAILYFVSDAPTALAFRRGNTHGLLALAGWTVFLSLAFAAIARRWPRATLDSPGRTLVARDFALLAGIAVVSHPVLDWMNTYGVRFLAPFSNRWFYGDTLAIIDPVLVVVLGLGWAISRFLVARRHANSALPARIAIAVALAYIISMKTMSEITRSAATRSFGLSAPSARELMVAPQAVVWRSRGVLVSDGAYSAWSRWSFDGLHVEQNGAMEARTPTGVDSASLAAVRATPDGEKFLSWSRFPYVVPDPATGTVFIGDLRYSSGTDASWAGIRVHTGVSAGR